MNHETRLWAVPLIALILGLVAFYGSKDKNATIAGYVFLAAFAILLWFLTTGGVRL
jgi:hypothetical protein